MLKKILAAAVIAIAVLALVVATRPADYKVERFVTVSAPAAVAWAQVADFHGWEAWSPWAKLDPGMKAEYGGAASGTGATYHWTGNDKVGEGRMTITGARPGSDVVIRLEFLKPMEDVATSTFSFAPDGAGTKVSWAMSGKLGFVGKAMCMVKSMDKMMGPDFEKGLAALKGVAEAQARKAASEAAAAPASAAAPAAK
jgi:Polyketide cyclase / dehydrase and lipid transport